MSALMFWETHKTRRSEDHHFKVVGSERAVVITIPGAHPLSAWKKVVPMVKFQECERCITLGAILSITLLSHEQYRQRWEANHETT